MCTVPNRNTTLVLLYYPGWGSTRVTAPARNNIGCPPSLELLLHGLAPHLNDTQKCIVESNETGPVKLFLNPAEVRSKWQEEERPDYHQSDVADDG